MTGRTDRKRLRKDAARLEQERRWREAEAACPLRRREIESLIEYLSEEIEAGGPVQTFALTRQWRAERGTDAEPFIAFMRAHRVACDFDFFLRGDPHTLFGPTADRLARMPIERDELEALIDHVDKCVRASGCDRTPRFAREWLLTSGTPVVPTITALVGQGGGSSEACTGRPGLAGVSQKAGR